VEFSSPTRRFCHFWQHSACEICGSITFLWKQKEENPTAKERNSLNAHAVFQFRIGDVNRVIVSMTDGSEGSLDITHTIVIHSDPEKRGKTDWPISLRDGYE
jgi:hypothetical protein